MASEPTQSEPSILQIADLRIDPLRHQVTRKGQPIELPELSFRLLLALTRAAPQGLSYQQLMEQVWPDRVVGEETVTQRVRLLRKALEDKPGAGQLIMTERGRGYRIAAQPHQAPQSGIKPWMIFAVGVLLIMGVVLGVWISRTSGPEFNLDPAPLDEVMANPIDPEQELLDQAWTYFARHQFDDNELAISLFQRALEQRPDDAQALAGLSMARAQRVTKFNAGPAEVDAAIELARRAVNLAPGSVAAHLALASALDAQGSTSRSIAAYEQVIALQPTHAGALSSAAYLYQMQGDLVRALEYNLRAARGENKPPYLDLQIGTTLYLLGFAPAAEPYFARAELLQPDNVFAPVDRARFLMREARLSEAEAVIDAAIERQVERPELLVMRGMMDLLKGDMGAAGTAFESAAEQGPHNMEAQNWWLVYQLMVGDADPQQVASQIQQYRESIESGDSWPTEALMLLDLLAASGDLEQSAIAMDQLFTSGYRDVAGLMIRPSLSSVRDTPQFLALVEAIQDDLAQQRRQVVTAPWLPQGFLNPEPATTP